MKTFTKTSTAKTNTYTVVFNDGTTVSRNAKKSYNFAIVLKIDDKDGFMGREWRLHGLASDVDKARKAASALRSLFASRRTGRHLRPAIPATVEVLSLSV